MEDKFMTLTLGHGPLSGSPASANYTITGPEHRLFFEPTPKRVRLEFGAEIIADSTDTKLLHETGMLPVYYLPRGDVRFDRLEATAHTSTCPFKGEACYWALRVGDRVAENVVWAYPTPKQEAHFLSDHVAFYLERIDAVYEEDEKLIGHPRDPYHRVDVRQSSRHVRVLAGEEVLADSKRPKAVFETGLGVRWYLPREDVVTHRLDASDETSICPYKGAASYWSLQGGPANVAWSYEEPLEEAVSLAGHLSFWGEGVRVEASD
jgi:uncharacterized protein (DUF427 family)